MLRSARILNKHAATDTPDLLQVPRIVGAFSTYPPRYACMPVLVGVYRGGDEPMMTLRVWSPSQSDSPLLPISRQVNRHHGRTMFYPPRIIRITHDACRIIGSFSLSLSLFRTWRGYAYLYF